MALSLPAEPDRPPAASSARDRARRAVRQWGAELLVVFIGVYAAFALQQFGERRTAEARRRQIHAALLSEVRDIGQEARRGAAEMRRIAERYDQKVAAGEMPPLQPLIVGAQWAPHMWQATLQAGGLTLLDVPTMYRLSAFYNQVSRTIAHFQQFVHLSETVLLPNLEKGASEFYDPATRQPRPKYAWYFTGFRTMAELNAAVAAEADSVSAVLERERR